MQKQVTRTLIATLFTGLALAAGDFTHVPERAAKAIAPEGLLKHIQVLASDEYEGRAPGSPGEKKTLDYIVAQCKAMKLAPGNPDGSYLEPVPLWGITPGGEVTLDAGGKTFPLTAGQDYRLASTLPKPEVDIDGAPIVFVGYGVVAPEYQWDD